MFYYERPKIREVFEYRRQSLDEKDVRQTHSLPFQAQFNREFADRFDLKIVDTFVDDASAKVPNNRPNFTAMLKELRTKNPSVKRAEGILCWHPDRLSRNGLEAGQLVQMIVDEQIKDMFFPTYHFHNDPSGIEHLMMEFGRAISYSGWLSINSKRGSVGREKQGAWVYGRSKFGYTKLRECPEHAKRCSLFPIPHPKTYPARKRLVELWLNGVTDEACGKIINREFGLTITHSAVNAIRRDPFNYGVYVIKPGTKDERQVDFRELAAPDGTVFEPVTDEATYWKFQSAARQQQPLKVKTKHLNPLQGVVRCGDCKNPMSPARRSILRKGGIYVPQLGYECHTKGCKARRVKADALFDQIGKLIEARFGVLDKKHYHQYLIGLRSFLAAEIKRAGVACTRYSKRLKDLEKSKGDVVEKRLSAINSYEYDDDTRNWCNSRLKELDREIGDVKSELAKLGDDTKARVRTFRQIIELKENLHHYWLAADDTQKRAFCDKLLMSLNIKDREIRSVSWKKPVCDWPKTPKILIGGAKRQRLEPYFARLWCSIGQETDDHQKIELISLAQALIQGRPAEDRFCIMKGPSMDSS